MHKYIQAYHDKLADRDVAICAILHDVITQNLPNSVSKVWHGHPVWFLDGNPIVGYSKLKNDVRLMFWSGQSFDEPTLVPGGKFKAAEIRYIDVSQIHSDDLKRILEKAVKIQWDYKHIVKNRGRLDRLV